MSKEDVFEQLFDFKNIVEACDDCHAFTDVVLKVPMGEYKVGDKFASVWLFWDKAEAHFFTDPDDEEPVSKLPLRLTIG